MTERPEMWVKWGSSQQTLSWWAISETAGLPSIHLKNDCERYMGVVEAVEVLLVEERQAQVHSCPARYQIHR